MVISSLMLHLTTRLLPLFSSLCSQISFLQCCVFWCGWWSSDSCWSKHWHPGCVGTKALSTRSLDGEPQRIGLPGGASVLRGSSHVTWVNKPSVWSEVEVVSCNGGRSNCGQRELVQILEGYPVHLSQEVPLRSERGWERANRNSQFGWCGC